MPKIICYGSDGKVLEGLMQWDVGRTIVFKGIESSTLPMFHFCNKRSYRALVVQPEQLDDGLFVKVPNILLQEALAINVYVYEQIDEDEAKTIWTASIPVAARKKPFDYEYTENIGYTNWVEIDAQAKAVIEELNAINTRSTELLSEVESVSVELNDALPKVNSAIEEANAAKEAAIQAADIARAAGVAAQGIVDSISPEITKLRNDMDELLAAGIPNFAPVDSSILIQKSDDDSTSIGVRISSADGNVLSLKDDGLYVKVDMVSIKSVSGLEDRLQNIEDSVSWQDI